MKKIYLFLISFFFPFVVWAIPINNYNIKVNINDYNNLKFQKIIEASDNKLLQETLNKNINNINISNNNIVSNITYNTEESNDFVTIKYNQSASKILLNYEMLLDYKEKDAIYNYPLISNLNNSIKNISLQIHLPEDYTTVELILDDKKVSNQFYKINDDILNAKITNFKENSTLYLKIIRKQEVKISLLTKISLIFPIVGTIISYLIWYFLGKDHPYKVKKTSTLPKDTNVIESAINFNGEITEQNIKLLLIQLANEGYIKMENTSQGIKLIKDKKYDGKKYLISLFIRCLFKSPSKSQTYVDEILLSDINFKSLTFQINERLNETNAIEQYFEKTSSINRVYIILIVVISLLLVSCNPLLGYNKTWLILIGTFLSLITFFIINKAVSKFDFDKLKISEFIASFAIIIAVTYLLAIKFIDIKRLYINAYIIGIVCSTLMLILYKYMPKRTKKGTKLIGTLESIKLFIESSTIEEFNRVLEVNPSYIYEIIPYTYVFNNQDILKEKLKNQKFKSPTWINKQENLTINEIYNFIDKLCDL